jgi:hypothetical protein
MAAMSRSSAADTRAGNTSAPDQWSASPSATCRPPSRNSKRVDIELLGEPGPTWQYFRGPTATSTNSSPADTPQHRQQAPSAAKSGSLQHTASHVRDVLVLTHSEDTDEGQELVEPPGGEAYPLYFPPNEQGFPDIFVRPDLSTARRLP